MHFVSSKPQHTKAQKQHGTRSTKWLFLIAPSAAPSSRAEPLHNPGWGGRKSRPNRTPLPAELCSGSAYLQAVLGSCLCADNKLLKKDWKPSCLAATKQETGSFQGGICTPKSIGSPPGSPHTPHLPHTPLGVPSSRRLPGTGRHSASRWIESLFAVTFFLWQHNH